MSKTLASRNFASGPASSVADITTMARSSVQSQPASRVPGLNRVDAALVKFIEHHDAKLTEQRIALQPRGQDSFRRDQQLRSRREASLESDLPSDLLADFPATFLRDASRQRARCNAAWLQQNRFAEGVRAGGCGWSCRTRRRDDHRRAVLRTCAMISSTWASIGAAFAPQRALWRTTTISITPLKARHRRTRRTIRRTLVTTGRAERARNLRRSRGRRRRVRHDRRRNFRRRTAHRRAAGDLTERGKDEKP